MRFWDLMRFGAAAWGGNTRERCRSRARTYAAVNIICSLIKLLGGLHLVAIMFINFDYIKPLRIQFNIDMKKSDVATKNIVEL